MQLGPQGARARLRELDELLRDRWSPRRSRAGAGPTATPPGRWPANPPRGAARTAGPQPPASPGSTTAESRHTRRSGGRGCPQDGPGARVARCDPGIPIQEAGLANSAGGSGTSCKRQPARQQQQPAGEGGPRGIGAACARGHSCPLQRAPLAGQQGNPVIYGSCCGRMSARLAGGQECPRSLLSGDWLASLQRLGWRSSACPKGRSAPGDTFPPPLPAAR